MALYTCNECGNQVSDKSTVCLKCGNPISEILKSAEDKKKEKKKKIIKIASIIIGVIALVLLVLFLYMKFRPKENVFFADVRWHSDYSTVLQTVRTAYDEDNVTENDEKDSILVTFEDYLEQKDINGLVSYGFTDGKLTKVSVIALRGENANITGDDLLKKYGEMLDDYVGKRDKEASSAIAEATWTSDKYTVELSGLTSDLITIEFKTPDDKSDSKE